MQSPRVVFRGLRFKLFLDISAIDDLLVDVRAVLTSSLEEILRGLLLRHWRRREEQFRRSEVREARQEGREEKGTKGECVGLVELRLGRSQQFVLRHDWQNNGTKVDR